MLCSKIHTIHQLCVKFRKHLNNLIVRRVLIRNLKPLNISMWKRGSLAVLIWTWFIIIRECWCLGHLNVLLKLTPGKWRGTAKQLKNIINFQMLFSDMITQGYNVFLRWYKCSQIAFLLKGSVLKGAVPEGIFQDSFLVVAIFLSIRSRVNVGGIPYSTDEKNAPHLSLFVQVGLSLENLIQ